MVKKKAIEFHSVPKRYCLKRNIFRLFRFRISKNFTAHEKWKSLALFDTNYAYFIRFSEISFRIMHIASNFSISFYKSYG